MRSAFQPCGDSIRQPNHVRVYLTVDFEVLEQLNISFTPSLVIYDFRRIGSHATAAPANANPLCTSCASCTRSELLQ